MTDPDRLLRRLSEQPGSPLERALLRAGCEVRVSEATRLAALEAVGLGSKRSSLARVRSLAFGRASLLIAAMVVSAAAVAIPLAQRLVGVESDSNPSASPQSLATERAPLAPSGAAAAPVDEPSVESADLPLDTPAVRAKRASSNAAARNVLAAELTALDAARGKLNAGDAKSALMLLDAYQREFPRPRLALEAEVLRIDALARSGQTETARKRAKAFVQNHPKGVLTGRVRRYLDK